VPLETGALLLAEPFADEKAFKRSAIVIADHSETDGTVGFIINKPIRMPVSAVVKGLSDFKGDIYFGGPVQTDTLHYIYRKGDLVKGSIHIKNGLFWGGDFDEIRFCLKNELIMPNEIRFMIGYTGWEMGQLDGEMDAGCWWSVEHDDSYIFNTPADDVWRTALALEGEHLEVIAQMPEQLMN
jgi:putative transcriptional regulator